MKCVVFVALVASATHATVHATQAKDDPVSDAAIQWIQLVDAGRNEEAASHGSQEVRSFDQWLNDLKTRRVGLGRLSKRQFVEMKRTAIIPGMPEVRPYFILRFKSSFEHKSTAVESITLSKVGCCWEVFAYKIE